MLSSVTVGCQHVLAAGNMPVPLRDMAGDVPRLSLEGALLMGREGGRVVAGDMPRAGLSCAMGLIGLVLLKGLHVLHDILLMTHLGLLRKCVRILRQSVCTLNAGVTQLHGIDLHCLDSMSRTFCNFAKVYSLVAIVLNMQGATVTASLVCLTTNRNALLHTPVFTQS